MNTKENKERLFAQYWKQKVIRVSVDAIVSQPVIEMFIDSDRWDESFLLLKPLSSITDDDAINVGCKSSEHVPENRVWSQPNIDYLRSKGYSLPYLGISVSDQIKYGWVKLNIT